MSELKPYKNQSKVTQVELICVLNKYDPYMFFSININHSFIKSIVSFVMSLFAVYSITRRRPCRNLNWFSIWFSIFQNLWRVWDSLNNMVDLVCAQFKCIVCILRVSPTHFLVATRLRKVFIINLHPQSSPRQNVAPHL